MSEVCKHPHAALKPADPRYDTFSFTWCPDCGSFRHRESPKWELTRAEAAMHAGDAVPPAASEVEQVFEVLLESGISRGTVRAMRLAYRASDAMGMKRSKIVTGVSLMAVAPALTGLAAAFSTLWSVLSFGLWGTVFFLAGAVLLVSGAKS